MPTLMNGALARVLDDNRDWRNTLTLHLYVNDRVPTPTDILSDYVEASFPGYAPQTMTGWTSAIIIADGIAQSQDDLHTFSCSSTPVPSQSVYGTYWTDPSNNLVRAARRPTGPVEMTAGVLYQVVPRVTEKNAAPC